MGGHCSWKLYLSFNPHTIIRSIFKHDETEAQRGYVKGPK